MSRCRHPVMHRNCIQKPGERDKVSMQPPSVAPRLWCHASVSQQVKAGTGRLPWADWPLPYWVKHDEITEQPELPGPLPPCSPLVTSGWYYTYTVHASRLHKRTRTHTHIHTAALTKASLHVINHTHAKTCMSAMNSKLMPPRVLYTSIHFSALILICSICETLAYMHTRMYSCVHVHLVSSVYKSVFIVQQSRPAGWACSLPLSPCRVCLFLSASQPPPPPPHSAWGVIKSVYACPPAKEIGARTHNHIRTTNTRVVT